MLEKKETVILIDVRTPEEHNDAHIPGSILMPLDTLGSVKKLPEDGRIVLYCRSGKRSLKALEVLSNKGFKDLTDLEGGIQGWAASGGEVISEPKK
ncbi:MAG: rhodanese-like domain-containing protein [Deltaproteobacteria bacterium]|nr:rhodanese-like domain-containing protein [Deltaproteobacteria bacterium]